MAIKRIESFMPYTAERPFFERKNFKNIADEEIGALYKALMMHTSGRSPYTATFQADLSNEGNSELGQVLSGFPKENVYYRRSPQELGKYDNLADHVVESITSESEVDPRIREMLQEYVDKNPQNAMYDAKKREYSPLKSLVAEFGAGLYSTYADDVRDIFNIGKAAYNQYLGDKNKGFGSLGEFNSEKSRRTARNWIGAGDATNEWQRTLDSSANMAGNLTSLVGGGWLLKALSKGAKLLVPKQIIKSLGKNAAAGAGLGALSQQLDEREVPMGYKVATMLAAPTVAKKGYGTIANMLDGSVASKVAKNNQILADELVKLSGVKQIPQEVEGLNQFRGKGAEALRNAAESRKKPLKSQYSTLLAEHEIKDDALKAVVGNLKSPKTKVMDGKGSRTTLSDYLNTKGLTPKNIKETASELYQIARRRNDHRIWNDYKTLNKALKDITKDTPELAKLNQMYAKASEYGKPLQLLADSISGKRGTAKTTNEIVDMFRKSFSDPEKLNRYVALMKSDIDKVTLNRIGSSVKDTKDFLNRYASNTVNSAKSINPDNLKNFGVLGSKNQKTFESLKRASGYLDELEKSLSTSIKGKGVWKNLMNFLRRGKDVDKGVGYALKPHTKPSWYQKWLKPFIKPHAIYPSKDLLTAALDENYRHGGLEDNKKLREILRSMEVK